MTLRARFTAGAILLVLVVLTSALANLYISQRRFLLGQIDLETRESTLKLASVCEEALASSSDLIALNYFRAWEKGPGADSVVLVLQDGTVYLHSQLLRGLSSAVGKPFEDPFAPEVRGAGAMARSIALERGRKILKIAAPVFVYKKRFGSVVAFYDLGALERQVGAALDAMAGRMLLSVALALCVGVILSVWLAGSLNRPIQQIVDGARRVGSGEFSHSIPVQRDDELGQLAREFNLMAQRLAELDRMKDRFLHSVSHEMRAPLSVIAGAAYHARRVTERQASEGLLDDVTEIERSVDRLTGFVNNILDLARLQAHRTTFAMGRVEPAAVLRELAQAFARRAEEYHIALSASAEDPARPIRGDAARLHQVLSNLVLNAFKYTPDGGTVEVRAANGPDGVTFSVSDSGPGLPPEAVPHLFTRFGVAEAVANPRGIPSSGLGLSICREIVEAHGGSIRALNGPVRGSIFQFTIPYFPEAA